MITCEICVEGIVGALAAVEGGADRVEVCAGLVEGGTTPSAGTIRLVSGIDVDVVALIRPRGGDFLYSDEEIEAMLMDIEVAKEAGLFGVATGALTNDGVVDKDTMVKIVEAADPVSVTFHRAFDMVRDPMEAMETLIDMGVDRILTSGQEKSVPEGIELIAELVEAADGRISIMPGGGIKEMNIREVVTRTGVQEVHFTASSPVESPMIHRNFRPRMGGSRIPGEFELVNTDPEVVRRIRGALSTG